MKSAPKLLSIFHKNKSLSKGSDYTIGVREWGRREHKLGRTKQYQPLYPDKSSLLTSDTEQSLHCFKALAYPLRCSVPNHG